MICTFLIIRYGQYGLSVEESLTMPLRQRAKERQPGSLDFNRLSPGYAPGLIRDYTQF